MEQLEVEELADRLCQEFDDAYYRIMNKILELALDHDNSI